MSLVYPRDFTEELHSRLTEHRQDNNMAKEWLPLPSPSVLASLLDLCFFASLSKEEGHSTRFSLIVADPEVSANLYRSRIVKFKSTIPASVEAIRKVSPAADPASIDICVIDIDGILKIWGLSYLRVRNDYTMLGLGSGVRVMAGRLGIVSVYDGPFHILTFSGGHAHFSNLDSMVNKWAFPELLKFAFSNTRSEDDKNSSARAISYMARSLLDSGIGATILVIPENHIPESIEEPRYVIDQNNIQDLTVMLVNESEYDFRAVISRLASIDGALLMNENCGLLGFGSMIQTTIKEEIRVDIINPYSTSEKRSVKLSEFSGGARHRSALIFCQRNPGAIAVVISEDDELSILFRRVDQEQVTAYRPFKSWSILTSDWT